MIRIPILRNPVPGSPAEELLVHMLSVEKKVEQHAYEIYCKRAAAGDPVADWKQAESDLVCKPASELSETECEFHARIALPGVDARCVRVAAVSDAVLIEAECNREELGKVRISELPSKTFYRKFALPEPIRVESVTAVLDRGMLHITACKASARRPMMAATA